MDNLFYKAFEDRFRGSRELVKSRLGVYLPFVEGVGSVRPELRVLDLGCGRGEWLELMCEHGANAQGVDTDAEMLADCHALNLDVVQDDALAHLKGCGDATFDIVSAFHIIEHIPFSDVCSLVKNALRVLTPGGLLIMETPNANNLSVGTEEFYFDPTHRRPVPSRLLSFVAEFYGFSRTKVLGLQEPDTVRDTPHVGLFNVLKNASPDYAVIAQSPGSSELHDCVDEPFDHEFGVTLADLASRFDQHIESTLSDMAGRIGHVEQCQAQLEQCQSQLGTLYASRSWRITKPLRKISALLHMLRSHVR